MSLVKDLKDVKLLKKTYKLDIAKIGARLKEYELLVTNYLNQAGNEWDYLASNVDVSYRRRYEKPYIAPLKYRDENGKLKIKCNACGKGLRANDNFCPFCGVRVNEAK